MKKYTPGCRCYYGIAYTPQSSIIERLCTTTAATILDLSTHPSFGAGAVVIGKDINARSLLVQKADGEVLLYSIGGSVTSLFPNTSDIAGYVGNLLNVYYFSEWGVGIAAVDNVEELFTFDSVGGFINGPLAVSMSVAEATFSRSLGNYTTDESGDILWMGITVTPSGGYIDTKHQLFRNSTEQAYFIMNFNGLLHRVGDDYIPSSMFSDGDDVYCQVKKYTNYSFQKNYFIKMTSGDRSGIYEEIDTDDLFEDFSLFAPYESLLFNDYDAITGTLDSYAKIYPFNASIVSKQRGRWIYSNIEQDERIISTSYPGPFVVIKY